MDGQPVCNIDSIDHPASGETLLDKALDPVCASDIAQSDHEAEWLRSSAEFREARKAGCFSDFDPPIRVVENLLSPRFLRSSVRHVFHVIPFS